MNFYIIIISMFAYFYITNDHIDIRHDDVITAINDNGCASKISGEVEIRPLPIRIKSYKAENL